jgi:hypothetical protein
VDNAGLWLMIISWRYKAVRYFVHVPRVEPHFNVTPSRVFRASVAFQNNNRTADPPTSLPHISHFPVAMDYFLAKVSQQAGTRLSPQSPFKKSQLTLLQSHSRLGSIFPTEAQPSRRSANRHRSGIIVTSQFAIRQCGRYISVRSFLSNKSPTVTFTLFD